MSEKGFSVRTDMADEAYKLWQGSADNTTALPGLIAETNTIHGFELNKIQILDETGESKLGKAKGTYYSLLLPDRHWNNKEVFYNAVNSVSELLSYLSVSSCSNILVSALGNPDISPDALGHLAAEKLLVTRHLDRNEFPQFNSLSLCRPGVLGTSGIESAIQVKAMAELIHADLVIVIDALAGSDTNRLCRCFQISDAGISPGSGVGNNRAEISKHSLGIPVISIGMPTVIDAAYFGADEPAEMFVTPRDIDVQVRAAAKIIAYAVNLAVHRGLRLNDIEELLF